MMRTPNSLIFILLTFILSCGSPTQYSHNGDESGIGGTGKQVAGLGGTGKRDGVGGTGHSGVGGTGKRNGVGGTGHSGVGGTGQIARTSGVGGTGIIGEVTGFGSIFVNGIEVEFAKDSKIYSDNKISNSSEALKPSIGDIVEILAHRVGDETLAKKINIRHEVVGPVESINIKRRRFTIIGQTISLNNPKLHLPELGQMIAVSGLRDSRGVIHATRLTLSKSKSVWLIDEIANNRGNTLKLGRTVIKTAQANRYRKGQVIRVRASYRNGQLFAEQIYTHHAFGNQVQHMVLQGFIRRGNRNNFEIGSIQFSSRSARIRSLLKQKPGIWTRIEVSRNRVGLWQVEQLINSSNMIRGSITPPLSSIETQQMFNQESNSESRAREHFNKSLDRGMLFNNDKRRSHGNGRTNSPMPNRPTRGIAPPPTPMVPRNTNTKSSRKMPKKRSGGMM